MLTKIPRINYRIFRNQVWPAGLTPFLKYNVVYGWNGCGKTTLSSLLRKLEKREIVPVGDGAFEVEVNGTTIPATDFAVNKALPPMKVFNRDFVDASVFAGTSALQRIYYFGENSVEKQKEIEALRADHAKESEANLRLKTEADNANTAVDQFCISQARLIKTLLSSSGRNSYNNYDKASFSRAAAALKKVDYATRRLDETQKANAKTKKDVQQQDALAEISATLPDFSGLIERATKLLSTTVVSRVLSDLAENPTAAKWVQTGITLHTGDHESPTCRFCQQPLPSQRLADLEAHFNREYQQLREDLSTTVEDCESAADVAAKIIPPVKDSFFPHLRGDYAAHAEALKTFRVSADAYLKDLAKQISAKNDKPFEALQLDALLTAPFPNVAAASLAVSELNKLVRLHNETATNFQKEIDAARKALEDDVIAEALPTLEQKQKDASDKKSAFDGSTSKLGDIAKKITDLEKQISDTLQPAAELTKELAAYLGQTDLAFEQKETGYVVMRGGVVAQHLSEGEKTAVAFLYFLKSLHDRSFKSANGVVVIDDPISSLDANALFCAFGYMREKTQHAAQLFVLTHNFTFFRQVKNWFVHLNKRQQQKGKPKVASFYMLRTIAPSGTRTSQLMALDPLLLDFESEYHYLFHRVSEEAQRNPPASLAEYYAMPNIARRLLESFLAFRYPTEDSLQQQLNRATGLDEAKRSRIIRFLHTHSHDGKVNEPEHDLSILSETPQILKDVLELIEKVDEPHYAEMQDVLSSAAAKR